MNSTSSVPKSVLRYELDKGYFNPETSFTQLCFPNEKTDEELNKYLASINHALTQA